jgi:ubiquinone/menaquinone biosynthesis C-methylase UbiE
VGVVAPPPDPLAFSRAQRKAAQLNGIRFERSYAQRLPHADGEFDRVLSSMMLHHLDDDAKSAAAAEVFRVLRPGGRLHLVDMGGDMTARDGLSARLVMHSRHAAGNLGDAIPRLLRAAGLDCTEVATQRHRFVGRLTYYRARRPA